MRVHAGFVVLLVLGAAFLSGCGSTHTDSGAHHHPASEGKQLRVVSYNIRHGRGMDGVVDLARTAAVLRALTPDIVALQEVDDGVTRSGGVDQAATLGGALGLSHVFGAFMDHQGGRYGMAILSRHPIVHSHALPLPRGNEPRIALVATIAPPGGSSLTVVNVHFDWVADDRYRFAQAETVAGFVTALDGPCVLLGDFNDVPGSRTLALFEGFMLPCHKPGAQRYTFPSDTPRKEIDYVFVAPPSAFAVEHTRVIDEPLASDHRPVYVELHRS